MAQHRICMPIAAATILAAGAQAAGAVELLDKSAQINPKSDPANAVVSWDLIPDKKNGFAVVWAKDGPDADANPDQLYVRFLKSSLKPDGGAVRYDDKVGGATPVQVSLAGSAMLGGGKLVSIWEGRFASTPAQGLAQVFENGKAKGGPKSVEDDDTVSMLFTKPLSDGRAIVPWAADGAASELSARFVEANGKLGPANLTIALERGSFFPTLYTLDEGFLAAGLRPDSKGGPGSEFAGQVYDAKGKKDGASFVIAPPSGAFQQVFNLVGLASGEFALTLCIQEGATPCDLKGQLFKRNGAKSGPSVTLVKGFGPMPVALTALEKSGFLLTSLEGDGEAKRLVFRRFDGKLKPVGKAAKTKPQAGLRRGAVRLLGDGRVAAAYLANDSGLFVQLVKP